MVGCCAHVKVDYKTREASNGATVGWWACEDCQMTFAPLGINFTGLGEMVRDALNGFSGRIIGKAVYLHESPKVLVDPMACSEGRPLSSEWIAESRVAPVTKTNVGMPMPTRGKE